MLAIQFQAGHGTVLSAPVFHLGIIKSKIAALVVPELTTAAELQAAQVVVVQASAVAAVPVSHFKSALVAFSVTGVPARFTKGIRSVSAGVHAVSWRFLSP